MTADMTLLVDLQSAEADYQDSRQVAEKHRERRNAQVKRAIEQGKTHAWIAEATGLSRARVGQLAPKHC